MTPFTQLKLSTLALLLLLSGCEKKTAEIKIQTSDATEITTTTVVLNGRIVDLAGHDKVQHGFVYADTEDPTLFDNDVKLGTISQAGDFSSALTGLEPNTTYYFKAYGQTSDQVTYDIEKSFTTLMVVQASVTIDSHSEITTGSVKVNITVSDDGGAEIFARGVCWSIEQNPTIEDSVTTEGSGKGIFTSSVTGLDCGTTYHIRAYATNSAGTAYSIPLTINTLDCTDNIPAVTTTSISGITETGAQGGGNVTDQGSSAVSARGICWSTSQNPTTSDSKTSDGSGTGSYTSSISGLTCGTTYYVRAYATNAAGTAYGSQMEFTTSDCPADPPAVTTSAIGSITETTASGGGEVTFDGGVGVTERGICWNTSPNPTTEDNKTSDGGGTGSYTSELSGLTCATTYYVRAYATNASGTAYGDQVEFTTLDCPADPPVVTTSALSGITDSTAMGGGNVTDDGGSAVTDKGLCWDLSPEPTILDNKASGGNGTGTFVANLTGLACMTTYYVRAYATNAAGTSYGEELEFTTLLCPNTVIDIDGNLYQTIEIGNQVWMAENLNVSRYPDGTPIPNITSYTEWRNLGDNDEAFCRYDNSQVLGETYGALYTWKAAVNGSAGSDSNPSGIQGVCPDGWHLPSDNEWIELEIFIGISPGSANSTGSRGEAGAKLKESGFEHWDSPNWGATNEFGFTALPAGYRSTSGTFAELRQETSWWTSTEDGGNAYYRDLYHDTMGMTRDVGRKWNGLSVRCVKD